MFWQNILSNSMIAMTRIIRLPRTKKDWIVLFIGVVILGVFEWFFKKIFPDMDDKRKRIVETIAVFVIIIILELIISD
ncbi:hypothetical protein [Ruminococcus sp.]|uniref:hypothetical protein n=1 Tax=Ruminococcus sp. TaxID=41978 RepID=UPI0025DBF7A4|nr:hypothetical protein [Ruminococcus sp.]MCR4639856.1 hypothetical protein [Ruminococcus sp.]